MSRMRQKRKAKALAEKEAQALEDQKLAEVQEALEAERIAAEMEASGETVFDESATPEMMPLGRLRSVVESLLFIADKPLSAARLRQLTREPEKARIEKILEELAEFYADRGIVLHVISGGYQFRTQPQNSEYVQKLVQGRPVRLTRAQLDTLAIIAYRQPITRPEIDEIRGVDSGGTLKVLQERSLIRILGKKEEPGRPLLYGTTTDFLDFFSLNDLQDLPTLREYHELSDESVRIVEEKLGSADEIEAEVSATDGGDGESGEGGPSNGGGAEGGGQPGASNEPTGAAPDGAQEPMAAESGEIGPDMSGDENPNGPDPADSSEFAGTSSSVEGPSDSSEEPADADRADEHADVLEAAASDEPLQASDGDASEESVEASDGDASEESVEASDGVVAEESSAVGSGPIRIDELEEAIASDGSEEGELPIVPPSEDEGPAKPPVEV